MTTAFSVPPNIQHRIQRHRLRAARGNQGRAPVRAGSPGHVDEARFVHRQSRNERIRQYRIIEAWNEAHRVRGRAPLTPSTMTILWVLLTVLLDEASGKLDAALAWIAKVSKRAYQTAVRAVAALEAAEIFIVQRRSRPGDDPNGPKWVQDTNLYRFQLPAKIRAWHEARQAAQARRMKARAPEDHDHAQESGEAANAEAEAAWAHDVSEKAKDEAASAALEAAQRARGPGAARLLAQAEAAARARGLLPPPESNS